MPKKRAWSRQFYFKDWEFLTGNDGFKRAIIWLRKEWKIPETGFKEQEEYRRWLNRRLACKKTYELDRRTLSKTIYFVNPKGGINGHSPVGRIESAHKATFLEYELFLRNINEICRLLNKSPRWVHFIQHYALFNQPLATTKKTPPVVTLRETKIDGEISKQIIRIEFDVDTLREDIDKSWKERALPLQKMMIGYGRARTKKALSMDRVINFLQPQKMKGKGYSMLLDKIITIKEEKMPLTSNVDKKIYDRLRKRNSRYDKRLKL